MELGNETALDYVADASLLRLERALARHEPDLHPQELVEGEAAARGSGLGRRFGSVDPAVGGVAVDEVVRVEHLLGQGLAQAARAGPRTRRSVCRTSERSCQVSTAALPDCGYTGTSTPVRSSPEPPRPTTSTTGFVIWRRPL